MGPRLREDDVIIGATGVQRCIPEQCRFAISRKADILFSVAAVAQLDRVLGYEPRGRGFNSCQPHQYCEEWPRKKFLGHFSFLRPFFEAAPSKSIIAASCQHRPTSCEMATGHFPLIHAPIAFLL
jgi:hypothetical protein